MQEVVKNSFSFPFLVNHNCYGTWARKFSFFFLYWVQKEDLRWVLKKLMGKLEKISFQKADE